MEECRKLKLFFPSCYSNVQNKRLNSTVRVACRRSMEKDGMNDEDGCERGGGGVWQRGGKDASENDVSERGGWRDNVHKDGVQIRTTSLSKRRARCGSK